MVGAARSIPEPEGSAHRARSGQLLFDDVIGPTGQSASRRTPLATSGTPTMLRAADDATWSARASGPNAPESIVVRPGVRRPSIARRSSRPVPLPPLVLGPPGAPGSPISVRPGVPSGLVAVPRSFGRRVPPAQPVRPRGATPPRRPRSSTPAAAAAPGGSWHPGRRGDPAKSRGTTPRAAGLDGPEVDEHPVVGPDVLVEPHGMVD